MNNLLTATEVKTLCPMININIDDTLIEYTVELTQNTLLIDSIGQEFYEEIFGQKSGNTLTTNNQYLWNNFLQHIVALGTWLNLTINLSYQLNEAGLRVKTSDHSTLAEAGDIGFYRTYIQNMIDNKRLALHNYIRFHQYYPLYYSNKYGDNPQNNIFNFKIGKVNGVENYNDPDEGPIN